jgi:RNA polymerase sigma-70 factor (ECF subfamily)
MFNFRKLSKNTKNSDLTELSDEELFSLCRQSGNKEAFGLLYSRYAHLVFGLCIKYLKNEEQSRDAVNEIFEKILNVSSEKEIKFFKSWLYKVSQNFCLMQLRKKIPQTEEITEQKDFSEDTFMDFSLVAHLKDEEETLLNRLRSAVEMLKNGQRKCIELFFWEGKSYKEIAAETGLSDKDVKSNLQNGKRNIKNYLDEKRKD